MVMVAEYRPWVSALARTAVTVPSRRSRLRRCRTADRRCNWAAWTSGFLTTFHCTVLAEVRARRERAARADISRAMLKL
jgi:hypothetical protein